MGDFLKVLTQPVAIEGSADLYTVVNEGGDVLYYGGPGVSASSNTGSLAVGSRVTVTPTTFLVSAGRSRVWVVPLTQAAEDARYQTQLPGVVLPALIDNAAATSFSVSAANRLSVVRAIIPRSGQLVDLAVLIGTSSGNLIGCVYDTGDALAGSRTKLWDSGSVAMGAANTFQVIGSPNITVTARQHVELGMIVDNATASFGRVTLATANSALLPPNFAVAPGGAQSKFCAIFNMGSFAAPATVAEASLTVNSGPIVMIARIV